MSVGLFAVDTNPMAGQLRCCSADSRFHGQRVAAPCVGDLTKDGDLFDLAHAMNPRALVTDQEAVHAGQAALYLDLETQHRPSSR